MQMENELVDDMLELGFTLYQIKAALEDGEWLKMADIGQAEAEDAHDAVVARIADRAQAIRKQMH